MSLLTGFTQPIDQSQQTFRLILKALSEPGHVVTLQGSPTWDRLNAASTAALLTLADQETPIQLLSLIHI